MKATLLFHSHSFMLIILSYPATSSALKRTILQVDEHFIFAVWTLQETHKQKEHDSDLNQSTFQLNNISGVIARASLKLEGSTIFSSQALHSVNNSQHQILRQF